MSDLYEQVTYNAPSGAQVGNSSAEKVAFFGGTPVTQPALALTTTALTALTTTQLPNFSTTEVAALNSAMLTLNNVVTDLKTLGLSA